MATVTLAPEVAVSFPFLTMEMFLGIIVSRCQLSENGCLVKWQGKATKVEDGLYQLTAPPSVRTFGSCEECFSANF